MKEKIKELRKAAGLTQQELAEMTGYKSNTAVAFWESGERLPPSDKLPALAAALHCTINDLFSTEAV